MAGEQGDILKARSIASQEISGSALAMKYAQEARDVEQAAQVRCSPKSSAEIQKIVKEKSSSHEASIIKEDEDRKNGLFEPKKLNPKDLGIKENMDQFEKGAYQTNTWHGYLDEQRLDSLVFVIAGSALANPMQGQVAILDNNGYGGKSSKYTTSSATGPVRIVSEKNGVLQLVSIAGTFEVFDPNTGGVTNKVTTPGGITYYFDLRTHIFY